MSACPSSNSDARSPTPPLPGPEAGIRRTPTILLVDDDERLTAILQNFLELNGFTVRSAFSGQEALRICADRLPDLILLDVRMPGMGGLEALRRIRHEHAAIPVIVVTYLDEERVREQAAALGVQDYLLKPVNFEDLKSLLHAVLRPHHPAGPAST